jgi:hypothetical protein
MPTSPDNEPRPELTDKEVDQPRQDPAASNAEQGTGLAPHFRVDPEQRVEGSYIVSVRRTTALEVVAKRAGVEMDCAFTTVHAFAAHLTDEQVTALRRDPEVTQIEDNEHITLDD